MIAHFDPSGTVISKRFVGGAVRLIERLYLQNALYSDSPRSGKVRRLKRSGSKIGHADSPPDCGAIFHEGWDTPIRRA